MLSPDIKQFSSIAIAGHAMSVRRLPGQIRSAVRGNQQDVFKPDFDIHEYSETVVTALTNKLHGTGDGHLNYRSENTWSLLPWNPHRPTFHPLDFFGLSISFLDTHKVDFPSYLFPPEDVINSYTQRLLNTRRTYEIGEQFSQALDLTDGYPLAASLVAFWASRIYARNMDKRIYPSISPAFEAMADWNKVLSPFPAYYPDKNEPAGDTYYFWTSFTMALVVEISTRMGKFKADGLFEQIWNHGPEIMVWSRKLFAGQPMQSTHKFPSEIGYAAGWSLINQFITLEKPSLPW